MGVGCVCVCGGGGVQGGRRGDKIELTQYPRTITKTDFSLWLV